MSDIKPLNRTTKTLAHVSYLSIDFQTLYAAKGSPRCQGRRCYISSNIGMQFKERGEWRHGNEYSTQTPKNSSLFSGQYLCNRSTLDIGFLGYIGIVWPKEHSPEISSVPAVTPCIILTAFPLQQWLQERAWMLLYGILPVYLVLSKLISTECRGCYCHRSVPCVTSLHYWLPTRNGSNEVFDPLWRLNFT